jgi:SIR2-like domain
MDTHQIKSEVQSFFSDGLTIIVGSGLSVAEGISGMSSLSTYLRENIQSLLDESEHDLWGKISTSLEEGKDLESTLQSHPPSSSLEIKINILTVKLIETDESRVIEQVIKDNRRLRLTNILNRCLRSEPIPIVTTNYDRLVEFAAYQAELGVDSLFVGTDFGRLNHNESYYSHCRGIEHKGRRAVLKFNPRAKVLKPHGSLDWYKTQDGPLRSNLKLNLPRLIITPGNGKYETGYQSPFDKHREISNDHIRKSERYLIIGYGFNDNHLQTHLEASLKKGKPALVLTRSLSDSAKELLKYSAGMTCFSKCEEGTKVDKRDNSFILEGIEWWDIEKLANEVLN